MCSMSGLVKIHREFARAHWRTSRGVSPSYALGAMSGKPARRASPSCPLQPEAGLPPAPWWARGRARWHARRSTDGTARASGTPATCPTPCPSRPPRCGPTTRATRPLPGGSTAAGSRSPGRPRRPRARATAAMRRTGTHVPAAPPHGSAETLPAAFPPALVRAAFRRTRRPVRRSSCSLSLTPSVLVSIVEERADRAREDIYEVVVSSTVAPPSDVVHCSRSQLLCSFSRSQDLMLRARCVKLCPRGDSWGDHHSGRNRPDGL